MALWNDGGPLRRQILQAVRKMDWTAVDVLRIGYEHDSNTGERFRSPVTILISVETGSTSFEEGYDAVAACICIPWAP